MAMQVFVCLLRRSGVSWMGNRDQTRGRRRPSAVKDMACVSAGIFSSSLDGRSLQPQCAASVRMPDGDQSFRILSRHVQDQEP